MALNCPCVVSAAFLSDYFSESVLSRTSRCKSRGSLRQSSTDISWPLQTDPSSGAVRRPCSPARHPGGSDGTQGPSHEQGGPGGACSEEDPSVRVVFPVALLKNLPSAGIHALPRFILVIPRVALGEGGLWSLPISGFQFWISARF